MGETNQFLLSQAQDLVLNKLLQHIPGQADKAL